VERPVVSFTRPKRCVIPTEAERRDLLFSQSPTEPKWKPHPPLVIPSEADLSRHAVEGSAVSLYRQRISVAGTPFPHTELSSRPERSVVEGPAVLAIINRGGQASNHSVAARQGHHATG
jgi:hypothetical protein